MRDLFLCTGCYIATTVSGLIIAYDSGPVADNKN